jgi:hypothetical protein
VAVNYSNNKPSINVYYNSISDNISRAREVLFGIEEEGIPYEIIKKDDKDAVDLSYIACEQSSLGVGIGIDGKNIAIHYIKLKKDIPLYEMSIESNDFILRALGINAARLVKGVPFKNFEEYADYNHSEIDEEACISIVEDNLEDEIRKIVRIVIERMKVR